MATQKAKGKGSMTNFTVVCERLVTEDEADAIETLVRLSHSCRVMIVHNDRNLGISSKRISRPVKTTTGIQPKGFRATISRFLAWILCIQQYLPHSKPRHIPKDEWERLVKRRRKGTLTKFTCEDGCISIDVPVWYDVLIHNIVIYGKHARCESAVQNSRFRWWGRAMDIGVEWTVSSHSSINRCHSRRRTPKHNTMIHTLFAKEIYGFIRKSENPNKSIVFSRFLNDVIDRCVTPEMRESIDKNYFGSAEWTLEPKLQISQAIQFVISQS